VRVWRELRRLGAVTLQSATWAIPVGDRFDEGLAKAVGLVERGDGQILVFDVTPTDASLGTLESIYTKEREAEWNEFCSECDKAVIELRGEFTKEKSKLAELDEEEHNLDRLRLWYRSCAPRTSSVLRRRPRPSSSSRGAPSYSRSSGNGSMRLVSDRDPGDGRGTDGRSPPPATNLRRRLRHRLRCPRRGGDP